MAEACERVEPLLSAHVDGELDDAADGLVAAHLGGCPACSQEVEDLAVVRSLVRSLPVRRLPEEVRSRAGAGTAGAEELPGTGSSRAVRVGIGLATVAGLLTGAAFSLGGQPPAETPVVVVPVDVYVADHFVHTVNRAMSLPVLELRR